MNIGNIFTTAIVSLSLFVLLYLPVEYYLVEVKLFLTKVPVAFSTIVLTALILVLSLVDWRKWSKPLLLVALIVLSTFSFFVYVRHRQAKEQIARSPKIFSVKPGSGVQGQIVTLRGLRFSGSLGKGKVVLGNQEMSIVEWGEGTIVVEQPVPSNFGRMPLYIIRSDEIKSNVLYYKVINPRDL